MLEPIQGEAGVWPATDQFMRDVRTLTQETNTLLILDEIQTGIGRTGKLFDFQHTGVTPDIMTLAKGLGGGVPLAALAAHKDVSCFDYGDQGGTFCGNPLMAAAGCAVLETITAPGFLETVVSNGIFLANTLTRLSEQFQLGGVRGKGLLLALDLKRDIAPKVADLALQRGLLLNAPRPDSLRFMPALNVSQLDITLMADTLDGVLRDVLAH
jgi:acetylornithine/N-succinyldiaminopimelate aminotransferase